MTSSVARLDDETIAQILNAVRTYDQFDEGIDPYGEHDMGRFTIGGEDYYWKIDSYDQNLEFHSPNPADPSVTILVLTIWSARRTKHFTATEGRNKVCFAQGSSPLPVKE